MAMQGYFDVFPEKRTTELRTAIFADGNADDPLPDGTFIFTEYFCTDPRCNCQRVLVKVFHARSEGAPPYEVATISYSWKSSNSDAQGARRWSGSRNGLGMSEFRRSHVSSVLGFQL